METRAKLVAAAMQEFAMYGFEGASTRSIAARAGVQHSRLIHHFESKLGMWKATMHQLFSELQAATEARMKGLEGFDPVTVLKTLQADFIRTSAKRPELHWLMSHHAGEGNERVTWVVDNLLRNQFPQFKDRILKVQATGHYVAGDPMHLHFTFIGAAMRIFMVSAEVEATMGRSPFSEEFIEEHIALCQRLFFREPPSS